MITKGQAMKFLGLTRNVDSARPIEFDKWTDTWKISPLYFVFDHRNSAIGQPVNIAECMYEKLNDMGILYQILEAHGSEYEVSI